MQTGQIGLVHFSPPSNDPRWQRVNELIAELRNLLIPE